MIQQELQEETILGVHLTDFIIPTILYMQIVSAFLVLFMHKIFRVFTPTGCHSKYSPQQLCLVVIQYVSFSQSLALLLPPLSLYLLSL